MSAIRHASALPVGRAAVSTGVGGVAAVFAQQLPSASSNEKRIVVQFRSVEPQGFPYQYPDEEPDFDAPRTIERLAQEQRAFLATIPQGFYVDVDMPDND